MRYVYLKQNNAVQELKRVSQLAGALPEGGPDAYVAHFLHIVGNDPGLLLSFLSDSPSGEYTQIGNVEARSFYWFSKLFRREGKTQHPIITFWPRVIVGIKIFFILIRFKPDVILCWATLFPLWAAYAISLLRNSHFVYCRHTAFSLDNKPWFKRATDVIDIWIMRHASKVIVHGPFLREEAIKYGVQANRLIEFNWSFNDMPDISDIQSEEARNKNTKKSILFIGRLEAYKGVFDLLDACEQRLRSDSDLKLLYAGSGSGLELLSEQVNKRGLTDNVTLLGKVPHEKLADVISDSIVVVTPTQSQFPEGRCMATMEGLVMGVPVLAPNFGPFPFLVKHGENGLLFEPDSVDDIRMHLFKLIDDEEFHKKLCAGARRTSMALKKQGPNFSEALRIAFNTN